MDPYLELHVDVCLEVYVSIKGDGTIRSVGIRRAIL